jgi:hypothetical protein
MDRERIISQMMIIYNEQNEQIVKEFGEPPESKYFNIEALQFKTIEKMNMIVLQKLRSLSDDDLMAEYEKVTKERL